MKKSSLIIAAAMLLLPLGLRAQFPQKPNDPVDYSLLFCPRLEGSHPAIFEMDVKREDFFYTQEKFKRVARGFDAGGLDDETLHFTGELIRTIEYTDDMLEKSIQVGFRRAGIRNRGELTELLKTAATIPPEMWDQMVDNIVGTAGDAVGAFSSAAAAPITLGKYIMKSILVATSDSKFEDHFDPTGLAMDAAGLTASLVALKFGAAAAAGTVSAATAAAVASGAAIVGIGLLTAGVGMAGISMYDAYNQVTSLRKDVADAIQKIALFYVYTNESLLNDYPYARKCWKIVVKGSDHKTGSFRDEPAMVTWSLDGVIDKNVTPQETVGDDGPQSFGGTYFGWLTSTVHMDMSSYDANYIFAVDNDAYLNPHATIKEQAIASRGVTDSDFIRSRANEARVLFPGMDGDFLYQRTKPTKGTFQQKLPVRIVVTNDWSDDYYDGDILQGKTEVNGTFPDITTVEKDFSIGHAYEASCQIVVGEYSFPWVQKAHEISTVGGVVETYYEDNQSQDNPEKIETEMEAMFPVQPCDVRLFVDMQSNVIERKPNVK